MKFTLSWLKEHLDTDEPVEKLADKLTMIGLEVEHIDDKAKALAPFTIARVISAEITRAMVKGAKAAALSSTRSTSSPIMVSLSTIAGKAASVSRCSFSQEKVNFTTTTLPPASGHRAA